MDMYLREGNDRIRTNRNNKVEHGGFRKTRERKNNDMIRD